MYILDSEEENESAACVKKLQRCSEGRRVVEEEWDEENDSCCLPQLITPSTNLHVSSQQLYHSCA